MGNSNNERSALIGKVFQHKSGGMTAQYTIESLLVSSAVVDTYVAAPQGMAIKLFLKLLAPALTAQPGFSTRFQDTVNLLLKASSPNIIPLFDYGANQEHFYLVLEHHKSPPLRIQLETQGTLSSDAALSVLQGLIGALDVAASQKICHGLLSPLSVHISKTRGPMLIDLGLAQLIGGTRLPRALNDDPYLAAFVAPEVRGGQPPDALSDQYSLAAMFYTMLTAKIPSETLWNDPAVSIFREPLAQALSSSPTTRFPKMVDFYKALVAAKEQPVKVAPVVPSMPDPSFAPTKPVDHTKPIPPPAPIDRTIVELPIAELKKDAETAIPAPIDRTVVEMPAVVVPAKPAAPPPATPAVPAVPAVAEHTMLEMPAFQPPKPEAEKAAPPPPPVVPAADRTMLEMPIAELKKELEKSAPVDRTIVELPVIVPPPVVPPAPPVQAAPVAEHTMLEMPIAELKKEAEKAVPAPLEPPAPEVERTMPEISIAEIQAAAANLVDEPGVAEVDDEPDIPRRPSGELPPLDLPKKEDKPAAKLEETARPVNKAPSAPPPREEVPPPYQPPKPARPAVLDATMPEMPAMNYNPPPSSIPPAPYGSSNTPGPSVPYNFNTVQGQGGQNAGRQIDRRYRTGTIDKDMLADPSRPSSDGLTGMIRSVPPASVRATANLEGGTDTPAPRRTSPIVWIVLAIILLGMAMTIGVVVLKVLKVF